MFLQNNGKHNVPIFGQHTCFYDLGIDQDLTKHMRKFEDIPAIGKQDHYEFHAFKDERLSMHGLILDEINGAI